MLIFIRCNDSTAKKKVFQALYIQHGEFVLVMGGARSGKSLWAEKLAASLSGDVTYLATALARDDEMLQRVALHQKRRPREWKTIEEPLAVSKVVKNLSKDEVLLVDCLTLWLTNLLFHHWPENGEPKGNPEQTQGFSMTERQGQVLEEARILANLSRKTEATVIAVSNEVGTGIVPADPLSRQFRDLSGWMNRIMAQSAHRVYMTMAGMAVDLRKIGVPVGEEI